MKYLLDTNVFIFLIERNFARLSKNHIAVIQNPANELLLSEASLFELAIKIRLEKPNFSAFNMKGIEKDRKLARIKLIKSKIAHYQNVTTIPKVLKKDGKPHADPFDLLIIAIAETENLPILSTDEYFPDYTAIETIA